MPEDRGVPTDEYVETVISAVEDRSDYSEELAELLATNCWRHDWPFEKSYFESDTINFGESDESTLDEYVETILKYQEYENDDDDDDYEDEEAEEFAEESIGMDSQISGALGLSATASTYDVVQAIAALRASSFSEEERSALQSLQREQRVSHFMEQVTPLDTIPGTTREKAEKLVEVEAKLGSHDANLRLNEWKAYQQNAEQAGVTQSLLRAHSESGTVEGGPAEAKIRNFAEDKGVSFNTALAQMAVSDASIVTEYRSEISG
tara:strand:- start:4664 stop:5455 length:792 start_codon:yes stop_codon:yes gene_type:complete